MNTNREDHKREWEKNFSGLNNVRIVPQEEQSQKDERIKIHYPLARFIAKGGLTRSNVPRFRNYSKDSVLVLNNFRIPLSPELKSKREWSKDKRPDILVITRNGDVLIIQCKQRSALGQESKIKKEFYSFTALHDFASIYPVVASKKILTDPWDKWEELYNERYAKGGRFLNFQQTIADLFSLRSDISRKKWADDITRCILDCRVSYGIAFDGGIDGKIMRKLAVISDEFEKWSKIKKDLYVFTVRDQDDAIEVSKL